MEPRRGMMFQVMTIEVPKGNYCHDPQTQVVCPQFRSLTGTPYCTIIEPERPLLRAGDAVLKPGECSGLLLSSIESPVTEVGKRKPNKKGYPVFDTYGNDVRRNPRLQKEPSQEE